MRYCIISLLVFASFIDLKAQDRCGDVQLFCRVYKEFTHDQWRNIRKEKYVGWSTYEAPQVTTVSLWDTATNQWVLSAKDSSWYENNARHILNSVYNDTWLPDVKSIWNEYYQPTAILRIQWNGTVWDTLDNTVITYSGYNELSRVTHVLANSIWAPDKQTAYHYDSSSNLIATICSFWLDSIWVNNSKSEFSWLGVSKTETNYNWDVILQEWLPEQRKTQDLNYGNLPEYEVIEHWNDSLIQWQPCDSIDNDNMYTLGNNATISSIHYRINGTTWLPWQSDSACYELYGAIDDVRKFPIDVFPNPANDVINFKGLELHHGAIYVELVNAIGQIVQEQAFEIDDKQCLSSCDLPNGVYSLLVRNSIGLIGNALVVISH